jgi:glycosyltransferase involved in cell wall biosynthesis
MNVVWSLPVRGERLDSSRGDLVRARSLIGALRADGHDVTVVELAARPANRLAVSIYREHVRAWCPRPVALAVRDVGRWIQGCRHGLRVAAEARRARADVIVETQVGFVTSGAIAARLTGVPLVLDDCSPDSEEHVFGAGLPGLARWALTVQARAARRVAVSSRAIADLLAGRGIAGARVHVVPNGVATVAFAAAARDVRRREPEPAGCVVIGFVGSFQPWHGVELLVEAVAAMPEAMDTRVLLVGDGPGLEPTLRAAEARGIRERVETTGAVPAGRVPELVAAMDIGVVPHSNEYGHPMKLVEYAAAGVPAVAPDLPPIREAIEPGKTGLLFAPGDAADLARVLSRLAGDPTLRRRLGDEAQRRVAAGASWSDRARALVADLGPVAGAAPAGVWSERAT